MTDAPDYSVTPGRPMAGVRIDACVFLAFVLLAVLYHAHGLLAGKLIASDDAYAYAYPLQLCARQGFSLWMPREFAGMPFLGLMQTGLLYPPNLLLSVLPAPAAFNAGIILHFALAGFFTYRYLRLIGVRVEAAIFGGIAFAFTGFFAAHRVHVSMMNAAAWTPLLLCLYERIRLTFDRRAALWAALAVAMQLLAGNMQVCLYTWLLLAGYQVWRWFGWNGSPPPAPSRWEGESGRQHFLATDHRSAGASPAVAKRTLNACTYIGTSLLPIVLGCLIALPPLVAGIELVTLSARPHRSYEFFTSFSLEPRLLPTLVLPFACGGGSYGYDRWGGASIVEKAGFAGFLCLALAVWRAARAGNSKTRPAPTGERAGNSKTRPAPTGEGAGNSKTRPAPTDGRTTVFWGVVAAAALLLALGGHNPVYRLLYHVPVVNLFRVPARSLLLFNLAIAVLAAFGFQQVFCMKQESRRRCESVAGVVAAIAAIAVLAAWGVHWQASRRFPMASMAILVPLLFACGGILLLLVRSRMKTDSRWIAAVAIVLAFAEAWSFGAFTDNHLWPAIACVHAKVVNTAESFLRQDFGHSRALYLTKSTRTLDNVPRGITTLNGYDPLILRDFHELLNMEAEGFCKNWSDLLANNRLLSALSVKYIVSDRPDFDRLIAESGEDAYAAVFETDGATVYENRGCLPRAYAVRRVKPAGGIGEIRREFASGTINPSDTALVSAADAKALGRTEFEPGTVRITRYEADEIRIDATFAGTGFLVLADQFYPGWKAYVDGKETAICKVNGILRGIAVPTGRHSILFAYRPRHIYAAGIAGIACLAGCVAFVMVRGRRM